MLWWKALKEQAMDCVFRSLGIFVVLTREAHLQYVVRMETEILRLQLPRLQHSEVAIWTKWFSKTTWQSIPGLAIGKNKCRSDIFYRRRPEDQGHAEEMFRVTRRSILFLFWNKGFGTKTTDFVAVNRSEASGWAQLCQTWKRCWPSGNKRKADMRKWDFW